MEDSEKHKELTDMFMQYLRESTKRFWDEEQNRYLRKHLQDGIARQDDNTGYFKKGGIVPNQKNKVQWSIGMASIEDYVPPTFTEPNYDWMPIPELTRLLNSAVEREDYENAAKLRDLIKKRQI